MKMNALGPTAGDTSCWHVLSATEVAHRLGVDPETGLTSDEAERRAIEYGPNEIQEQHHRSLWRMFFAQFTDFMILVLLAAALIAGLIGEPTDTIAILIIVILNGVIGFIQEYRAERAVAALRMLATLNATVRRDGQVCTLPASQLVPGDIVLVEAGNIVPADLRLVEAVQLKMEEAALTGESVPAEKHSAPLAEAAGALR